MQKVKVLSLPETIKGKIDVSSEGPSSGISRGRAFARNVDFSLIISDSERTFTFRISLNTPPTLATLVRDINLQQVWGNFSFVFHVANNCMFFAHIKVQSNLMG